MTSRTRSQQTAPQAIASHKAEIASLIAKLQGIVAAYPTDGNWPVAGSLGSIQERLKEIVDCHTVKAPELDRDEMTIWFDDERARDRAKRAMARKAPRSVILNSRLHDKGFGIQVKPADSTDDAAIDEAIDLLMETALETEGCVIPE